MPKKVMSIGEVANQAILSGASDEEALTTVLDKFPQARTTIASVKVYRSNLRREVKEGKREPGKEGAPERQRGALRKERSAMTAELASKLKETARLNALQEHHRHMRRQDERLKRLGNPAAYRMRLLTAYVGRVLALGTYTEVKSGKRKGELTRPKNAGRDRLAFFEAHPVSGIFS